jgi:hypothetical protein
MIKELKDVNKRFKDHLTEMKNRKSANETDRLNRIKNVVDISKAIII